jgi:hypothetical protein
MAASSQIINKGRISKSASLKILTAACIYLISALLLYQPYFQRFEKVDYLFILSTTIGSLGCFVLSRRWINSFLASLTAGVIYGFCPFNLSFSAYHSFATFPIAAIPWLFCIAAFVRFQTVRKKNLFEITGIIVLTLLPFVAIAAFFWMCAQPWWIRGPFFPIPKSEKLTFMNLAGLVMPFDSSQRFSFSLYHIPLAFMVMGSCVYAAAGRYRVTGLVFLGLGLAFFDVWSHVSPVIWAIVPVLFCSILIGIGMQAFAWANRPDNKWILTVALLMLILASITFTLKQGTLYNYSSAMYLSAAAVLSIIALIAKSELRLHTIRWLLLVTLTIADIALGAIYTIDKIL